MKPKKPLQARVGLRTKSSIKSLSNLKKISPKKVLRKSPLPTISKLKKEADKYHSLATRLRFAEKRNGEWQARCVTCIFPEWKSIKMLQCGHFMSRQYNSTRYDEENTAPQCYGCNVMQQGKQYAFSIWVDVNYGDGTAKKLYKLSRTPHQFKREELLDIIADRKAQVEFYGDQEKRS